MKLIIMQGIPGSGKSTIVGRIADENTVVASADDYMVDAEGNYAFDPTRLGYCHGQCRRVAIRGMDEGKTVILDNTNMRTQHVRPYIEAARERGYEVCAVYVNTPVDECIRRNSMRPPNRAVPAETIRRMASQREELPVKYIDYKKFGN